MPPGLKERKGTQDSLAGLVVMASLGLLGYTAAKGSAVQWGIRIRTMVAREIKVSQVYRGI